MSCPRSGCSPRSGSRPPHCRRRSDYPGGPSFSVRGAHASARGRVDACRRCAANRPRSGGFGSRVFSWPGRASRGRDDTGPGEGACASRPRASAQSERATRSWSRSSRGRPRRRLLQPSVHRRPESMPQVVSPAPPSSVVGRVRRYCGLRSAWSAVTHGDRLSSRRPLLRRLKRAGVDDSRPWTGVDASLTLGGVLDGPGHTGETVGAGSQRGPRSRAGCQAAITVANGGTAPMSNVGQGSPVGAAVEIPVVVVMAARTSASRSSSITRACSSARARPVAAWWRRA